MSLLADHPGSNLVCNGYKDEEYMELVRGPLAGRTIITRHLLSSRQHAQGTAVQCA